MKSLISTLIFFATVSAYALQAGPYILSGKVSASDEKTVTLDLGDQQAVLPMKLFPKNRMKDGKIEIGTQINVALTEDQKKEVKIQKK